MRATVAPHRVALWRHGAEGPVARLFGEVVVSLRGAPDELRRVVSVALSGHCVDLDHAAGLARHADGHADPALPFETGGETLIQVFLDHLDPRDCRGGLTVGLDSGRRLAFPGLETGHGAGEGLESRLVRDGLGRWRVEGRSAAPFEAIFQRMRLGRAEEERRVLPGGDFSLPVGPAFAETLGVDLSTSQVFGGTEHKHMLMGKFGVGSGRFLMADGVLLAPKIVHPFAYRALVARLDGAGLPGGRAACWDGFDEVEVFAPPDMAGAAGAAMSACPVPWRVTTFSRDPTPRPDILVVDPGGEPPDGAFSYLLFAELGADFPERAAACARAAARLPDGAALLDRSWLSASEGLVRTGEPSHGMAFSTPVPADLARATVADVRRRRLAPSRCVGCRLLPRCDGMIPYPYPVIGPARGSDCPVLAAFGG